MNGDEARMLAILAGRDHGAVLAHLKLSGEPLADNVLMEGDGVRVANVPLIGWYIVYKEDDTTWRRRGKPFVICAPVYEAKGIRVESWEAFCALTDEASVFLREWTNISEAWFMAAKMNPLVKIPVSLDVERYIGHLWERGCGDSTLCYAADCRMAEYIHNNKNKDMEKRMKDGTEFR